MINFDLIWFDSLGAKSTCTFVKTPDTSILIDPGIAVMQPSYPLSDTEKFFLEEKGFSKIKKASEKAEYVVISHYHYDHHNLRDIGIYQGKKLLIKNPNRWINKSQWDRSRVFLSWIYENLGRKIQDFEIKSEKEDFKDPIKSIPIAKSKNFGDYQKRRKDLLVKGRKRFKNLVRLWSNNPWIKEPKLKGMDVSYCDGKKYKIGKTFIRFTPPLFHGIEYARTGWVLSTIVEYENKKIMHTSDLQGPTIEDYAELIIKESPNVLILDGPATYLLGYMLNQTNLNRSIENAIRIIKEADFDLMIYDHHLLRDKNFRRRTKKVWETAKRHGKNVLTAAEYMGKKPLIEAL